MKKSILSCVGAVLMATIASAQKENFGLREKQPKEQLPVSKAEMHDFGKSRAEKNGGVTCQALDSNAWRIQGWRLIEADSVWPAAGLLDAGYDMSKWYPATVPGTVLTTLLDNRVYPDPYYGLNNLQIPEDLCRKEWLYRTMFDAPSKPKQRTWLLFNGINYRAAIYLNGTRIGEMIGAFARGKFDVTTLLREKNNVLVVRIYPPYNPGIPHEESMRSGGQGPNGGTLCLDGPTFISSEGWDWVPGIRDRNMGLWQDVQLLQAGDVTLSDPQVITDLPLPKTDRADVIVRATVKNHAAEKRSATVVVEISKELTSQLRIDLAAGEEKIVELPKIVMQNPKLWWPNGYGEPNLYVAKIEVKGEKESDVSDATTVRFGVREFSYTFTVDTEAKKDWRIELNPLAAYAKGKPLVNNIDRRKVEGDMCVPKLFKDADVSGLKDANDKPMGHYLALYVNGVAIFCKGGNWGMDDALKRVSRERLEPAIRLHRDAGFTMVRNWTGESTEPEFFDLCDEYGLLVWNDFWYSTQGYNLEPNDAALFMTNVRDTVRRYRNHASLAVWCPRNEGWAHENLEPQIAALLVKEDPTRYYQGNSRLQNLRPSGPWRFHTDLKDYFTKHGFGFNTELGNFAVPTFETLKTFIPAEDLWPINDVWYYHDFHAEHNQDLYRKAIAERYGEPKNAEEFCQRAQYVNYDSLRAMFEGYTCRLWDNASGLLLWMSHPAWPSMIWQLYSYDFETTGAYYGAKKACEPIHIQMNAHDRKVVVVNTTRNPLGACVVRMTQVAFTGEKIVEKEEALPGLDANAKRDCFVVAPVNSEQPVLVRLELLGADKRVLSLNDYWQAGKNQFLAFQDACDGLRVMVDGKSVRVTNTGKTIVAGVHLQLRDRQTKARILPAYFSDGWFNLLPGETREVQYSGATGEVIATCK
ncbi:MAG: glycoside hydrolase family 2 TIM barrel-domain containing protein [bacterium]